MSANPVIKLTAATAAFKQSQMEDVSAAAGSVVMAAHTSSAMSFDNTVFQNMHLAPASNQWPAAQLLSIDSSSAAYSDSKLQVWEIGLGSRTSAKDLKSSSGFDRPFLTINSAGFQDLVMVSGVSVCLVDAVQCTHICCSFGPCSGTKHAD